MGSKKNQLVLGILAHVDAGKTTLSEGLLYHSGALKKLGRVDHKNAFLDTDHMERERGITIFAKQAIFSVGTTEFTLLDTPGHVDFSSEMERTLQVLDYAVLVISGTDGVQGHSHTLWQLLRRHQVPTLLFMNKMDLPGCDRAGLLEELSRHFGEGFVDFGQPPSPSFYEQIALCGEQAMEEFFQTETVSPGQMANLVATRKLFPCFFGSALKLSGVPALLQGLQSLTRPKSYPQDFAAQIYKIARDPQGTRLTYLKVTGGCLAVKDLLRGNGWAEKADQLRVYSGLRFSQLDCAPAGTVCAVVGLQQSRVGEGLGAATAAKSPVLFPVLSYRVGLPRGYDPHTALTLLSQLEEEDPQLHLVWNTRLQEIHMQLMGEVQLEILKRQILERFSLEITFCEGGILYRETILNPVEGIGHYEPLRHYAEVQLRLRPGPPGSGLQFTSHCSEDVLAGSWQRLILTHLAEKSHRGVLTGAPLTDLSITLTAGRAHEKHTQGGDFRQATYRAVRQGLMGAKSILLEPWYAFRLEIPNDCFGRALGDMQRLFAKMNPPETLGERTLLTGEAPVVLLRDYGKGLASYTRGLGKFTCTPSSYRPCHNEREVVAALGYDPVRDLENPTDSIFCAHGAGFSVPWQQVPQHAHLESSLRPARPPATPAPALRSSSAYRGTLEEDKALLAIFEKTYGPVKDHFFRPQSAPHKQEMTTAFVKEPEYLLVDGYNMIHAWDELAAIAADHLDLARSLLMDLLCNYRGFRDCVLILVFDAYKVPGNPGQVIRYHNIDVVYTKEAETADSYIEKATYALAGRRRVRVATSDAMEQLIILGHGALRVSAEAFRQEVLAVKAEITQALNQQKQGDKNRPLGELLGKLGE